MKWKFVTLVLLACLSFIYVNKFHKDKYNDAVSLVIKKSKSNLKSLGKKVGLDVGPTELSPAPSEAVLTQDHNIPTVQLASEQSTIGDHTNQIAMRARLAKQCPVAQAIETSNYGSQIKSIGLSYFTKYEPNFHFLYCSIPKVASSNWKRTLIVLSYDEEKRKSTTIEDINSLKNVHNNPAVKALTKVSGSPFYMPYANYYKFVFFRHPFTRMVSAWRNKFQPIHGKVNKYFYKNFGLKIMRITRKDKGVAAFIKNKEPFLSFAEFIVGIRNRIIDRHWMPQSEICRPCDLQYSFVGFFENLDNDTTFIMNHVGITDANLIPTKISLAGSHLSTTVVTKDLFNDLSQADIDMLYEYYRKDFELFGYDKDVNSPTFPKPGVSTVLNS